MIGIFRNQGCRAIPAAGAEINDQGIKAGTCEKDPA